MRIQYKATRKSVKASAKPNRMRRPIKAEEEMIEDIPVMEDGPGELLFEATDVADLLAEVTNEEVNMDMDDNVVVFTIGEDEYTIEPEGDEEVLEAVRKPMRNKRPVKSTEKVKAGCDSKKPQDEEKKSAARPSVRRK